MAQVFISHSKDDKIGREFFDKLFGSFQHEAYWYSWEGPEPPHAQTLLNAISGAASVFVILSKGMEQSHTRTWVGYEVGIAATLNRNVWVFEPMNESWNVPVPSVTAYIKFPETLTQKQVYPYYEIVRYAGRKIIYHEDPQSSLQRIICPWDDCKADYHIYVVGAKFLCPVCRRKITLPS